MSDKMTPAEIQAIIGGLVLLIQLVSTQVENSLDLTPEQKKELIDRITAAQNAVPKWE